MFPRVLLAVGFAIALATGLVSATLHAEEMAWTVDRYESDFPDDPDTVILSYGIPNTDAVAFEATCGGPDGVMPRAVFWYDIVDLSEGEDVVVSFSAGDVEAELPGQVFGKDAEVGVSGIQVAIEAGAPLWTAMRKGAALTFGIAGGKREALQLTGAAQAVGDFVSACQAPAQPDVARPSSTIPAAVPTSPQAEAVSCDKFGTIKSVESKTPTTVTFVNKSDGYRALAWIDPEGTPVDNAGLNPGESVTVPTFQTHAWMITDGPGNCIEMFVPTGRNTMFEITAPASILGPEDD